MSYFDTDVLHKRIAELQQELLKKHSKVHEALRLRDLANERIAELEKERSVCREILLDSEKTDYDKYVQLFNVLREGGAE